MAENQNGADQPYHYKGVGGQQLLLSLEFPSQSKSHQDRGPIGVAHSVNSLIGIMTDDCWHGNRRGVLCCRSDITECRFYYLLPASRYPNAGPGLVVGECVYPLDFRRSGTTGAPGLFVCNATLMTDATGIRTDETCPCFGRLITERDVEFFS